MFPCSLPVYPLPLPFGAAERYGAWDPEHWYARAELRVPRGPSGHKRGQSSLTQGRISPFYKGWRFPKKRPS